MKSPFSDQEAAFKSLGLVETPAFIRPMKLFGAKLQGALAKLSEARPLSFAGATEGSPRLYPLASAKGRISRG
jgi:hypothetical protein